MKPPTGARQEGRYRAPNPASILLAVALVTAPTGARPGPAAAQAVDVDWGAVSAVLMERMALEPGARVLLVGRAGDFDPLVPLLRRGVDGAGAVDLGAVSVDGRPFAGTGASDFVRSLEGLDRAALVARLRTVDVGVMLPGATPQDPVYAGLQEVLRGGHGRTVHFHWAGAYGFDGVLLALSPNINQTYLTSLITTQYDALSSAQSTFEEAARAATVRVTTPAGTDLSFRVGDRPVTRQDGDASAARAARARNLVDREVELPAGAIRVAPLEETVQGTIAFPPTVWGGVEVDGLRLTIRDGRVVDVEARTGVDAVLAEMDAAGPAGRAFREFALGLNPTLAIPEDRPRWIPYYGYGAGVVRLSLGDNSELGGAVTGGYVRWNFFTDATVHVGSDLWVDGGRLVR